MQNILRFPFHVSNYVSMCALRAHTHIHTLKFYRATLRACLLIMHHTLLCQKRYCSQTIKSLLRTFLLSFGMLCVYYTVTKSYRYMHAMASNWNYENDSLFFVLFRCCWLMLSFIYISRGSSPCSSLFLYAFLISIFIVRVAKYFVSQFPSFMVRLRCGNLIVM